MHLVTLNAAGHASPGVIAGDSILDLGAAVAILSVAKLSPSGMRGLLEGVDAEVAEKFRGENREGGANVAETRAHPGTSERLGRSVAIVLVGGDLERRQNDGVTFYGLNRRSRDRLG